MTDPTIHEVLATYSDEQIDILKRMIDEALNYRSSRTVYNRVIESLNKDQLKVFHYLIGLAVENRKQRDEIKKYVYGEFYRRG